jgi:HSP20 family molecular chaperone IbpA
VFRRSLTSPNGVDSEKISAVLKNGLLTVTLPLKPEVAKSAKQIEINATE